ncbi:MAG: hypothetical protein ACAI25_05910, partial [Planctomycetota bacterium]
MFSLLAVAAAASAGALVSTSAHAQDRPQPPAQPERKFKIGAERMSIKAFLQVLSDRGGFTFLDEAGLDTGEITVTAQKELTRDEA